MEGIFAEFGNENGLRSYPFAAGCIPVSTEGVQIPPGLFIDASLFPVNPSGTLYLSSVSADGEVAISDDFGVVMTSDEIAGGTILFRDTSPLRRRSGMMIASSQGMLEEFVGVGIDREYDRSSTAFSAKCVSPIRVNGVSSLNVSESGAKTGSISFANDDSDEVRALVGKRQDGRNYLRFDIWPYSKPAVDTSIKTIICVVDGNTPFRISKLSQNTIAVYLAGIDKEDVCSSAHRENQFEMVDTCGECQVGDEDPMPAKRVFQTEEVNISRESGGAFYLVAPNFPGYGNPIAITLTSGDAIPNVSGPRAIVDVSTMSAEIPVDEFADKMSPNEVMIHVPGLSGGRK